MDFFLTISIIRQDADQVAEFFYRFHLFTINHQLSNSVFIINTYMYANCHPLGIVYVDRKIHFLGQ